LDNAALIVFTSGTTGRPKGVVLGHLGYCNKLRAFEEALQFPVGAITLQALQLTFSFAQWSSIFTLTKGGRVLILQKFDPATVLNSFAKEKTYWFPAVPTMLRLLDSAMTADTNLAKNAKGIGSPAYILAGGEVLVSSLGLRIQELFPQSLLGDIYGLTETNSGDFILPPGSYDRYCGSIGLPSPGVSFQIVKEDGQIAEQDEIGELWVKTPFLMKGYFGNPEETAKACTDGFIKTGDQGYCDKDGCVRLVGRTKEIINRGGLKVSPLEVEDVLCRHPGVMVALAAGVPDSIYGEVVCAGVVPRGVDISIEQLSEWCANHLEKFKVPSHFLVLGEIPVGSTGKGDRRSLRAMFLEKAEILGVPKTKLVM
jgi:long-chain acyl-CoA synthetase